MTERPSVFLIMLPWEWMSVACRRAIEFKKLIVMTYSISRMKFNCFQVLKVKVCQIKSLKVNVTRPRHTVIEINGLRAP